MDTEFDDIPPADLPFSERVRSCLARAGIWRISQLDGKTLDDLPDDLRLRDMPLPTRAYGELC